MTASVDGVSGGTVGGSPALVGGTGRIPSPEGAVGARGGGGGGGARVSRGGRRLSRPYAVRPPLVDPASLREHPGRQVRRDDHRPLGRQPAPALGGATTDLQDAEPGEAVRRSQDPSRLLAQPLRTPDEVGVAQERAVLGVVVHRLGVPPALVGARRLGLVGAAPRDGGEGAALGGRHTASCFDPCVTGPLGWTSTFVRGLDPTRSARPHGGHARSHLFNLSTIGVPTT